MNMKLKFDMEYKGHSELYTHPTPTSLQYQQGIKIKQNMHPGEMSSFWSWLNSFISACWKYCTNTLSIFPLHHNPKKSSAKDTNNFRVNQLC